MLDGPNDEIMSRTTLITQLAITPTITQCCHQLLVGCCVPPSNGGHLRPRVSPSLYFLMGLVLAPQTREPAMAPPHPMVQALHGPMGSHGAMSWGHGGCCRGEKGQSCSVIGGWGLILLFCVVCCCVGLHKCMVVQRVEQIGVSVPISNSMHFPLPSNFVLMFVNFLSYLLFGILLLNKTVNIENTMINAGAKPSQMMK